MKILVLGANGQLGRTLLSHGGLSRRGAVRAASRDGILTDGTSGLVADLSDLPGLIALLDREDPDVVVNAAAYTAVDRAEKDEASATRINAEAVAVLGRWAATAGRLLVHYSTDYVFAGDASAPYTEEASVAPAGAYGRSKLAGETALRSSGAPHFILRTAWVYSPLGSNFLRTMLRLGADRDELRVVADQHGTPTDTNLIVNGTLAAIDRWLAVDAAERLGIEGTYHLTASGQTTWHGFAEAIFRGATSRGLLQRSPVVQPIQTVDYPTPARRPAYSVLENNRFSQTFGFDLPDWRVGLDLTLNTLSHSSD